MDIMIVLIIIAAAVLYSGNIFFQKCRANRSRKNGCSCSLCPKGGSCNACPLDRTELKQ